jgi:hypothetical protein
VDIVLLLTHPRGSDALRGCHHHWFDEYMSGETVRCLPLTRTTNLSFGTNITATSAPIDAFSHRPRKQISGAQSPFLSNGACAAESAVEENSIALRR